MLTLENNNHVCIAHYNDSLDWVNNLNLPFTIISRQHTEENVWPNVGRKASVYLKFIINNYDNLWGVTYFIGDTPRKPYFNMTVWETINSIIADKDILPGYYSITDEPPVKLTDQNLISKFDMCKGFIEYAINRRINYNEFNGKIHNHFFLTKNFILTYPKSFYIELQEGLKKKCEDMIKNPDKYGVKNPSVLLEQLFDYSWQFIFNV